MWEKSVTARTADGRWGRKSFGSYLSVCDALKGGAFEFGCSLFEQCCLSYRHRGQARLCLDLGINSEVRGVDGKL